MFKRYIIISAFLIGFEPTWILGFELVRGFEAFGYYATISLITLSPEILKLFLVSLSPWRV